MPSLTSAAFEPGDLEVKGSVSHCQFPPNHLSSFSELPSKVPAHFINIPALLTPPAAPFLEEKWPFEGNTAHFFIIFFFFFKRVESDIRDLAKVEYFPPSCLLNLLVRMEKIWIKLSPGGDDALPGSKTSSGL